MAERVSYGLAPRLDIQQILAEARSRWLRPAEICEILRNYQKFHIQSEPPNRPPSGSLFLFDRKVLRYFRKDGHNWRKKKDGKTVKEAHEKLKVGSVDVLHCYYAHGEENETFQRRSYWMLEQDLMHIVFVHYLEVKGNRTNIGGIRERDEFASDFQKDSPLSSSFPTNHKGAPCGSTDSPSPTNSLTSLYEDADSEDSYQASSRSRFLESPSMENGPLSDRMDAGGASSYFVHPSADNYSVSLIGANYISDVQKDGPRDSDGITHVTGSQDAIDLASWEAVLENSRGFHSSVASRASSEPQSTLTDIFLGQENMTIGEHLTGESVLKEEFQNTVPREPNWQISYGNNSVHLSTWPMNQLSNFELENDLDTALFEPGTLNMNARSAPEPFSTHPVQQNEQPVQNYLQTQLTNAESQFSIKSNSETDMLFEGSNGNYALTLRKPLLDGEEALKKVDSFSRWVTRELGDVDDLHLQSSSGLSWSTVECGSVVDDSSLSPSLSQDQLFSILDFSPKWAYTDSETEVLITGTFLKSLPEVTKCNWSCMFGEVEVPAEVLANGILCCHTPPHTVGQVPFYITCSNRVACSEVREFDYRVGSIKDIDIAVIYSGAANDMHLHLRLERLLSLRSVIPPSHVVESVTVKQELISKIITLKEEEEYNQTPEPILQRGLFQHEVEYLLKLLLKEKLYSWLLRKVCEGGKGPNILDDDGQGVIHLAAALGYDWAIKPIVTAEVSINFRDINGWTALHWAASCGREQTVAFLVSLGAAPGALTDPSPQFPLGRTPADLASGKGHKGISGFIAESSLTSYLKSLTMNDQTEDGMPEVSGTKGVLTISERTATPVNYIDAADALSLKDSLNAVCNATQAADRIHQMFRMHSFERRRITQHDDGGGSLSDECALSLVSAKTRKPGQSDRLVHSAATHIQKKYRGWKKRKEFLTIRQRIVKIQAHVRGHQVRKQYRTIVWSVGILEKVILRWRRKGIGLRGFRPDVHKDPKPQVVPSAEDDYDFLKEGRKQTEERLQKALTRVKSMVQYPEGRAQYRRLLTVVEGFQETKASLFHQISLSLPGVLACKQEMITERIMLSNLLFVAILGLLTTSWGEDRLLDPSKLEMFVDELPDMPKIQGFHVVSGVLKSKSLKIGMFKKKWKFHRDLPPTPVFAYGVTKDTATVPGPTIEALHGVDTYVTWRNHLPGKHILPWDPTIPTAMPAKQRGIPTVVHLHGGIDEPESDGNSNSWFTSGFKSRGPTWTKKKYHYHNQQHPGNLWYHDHAMGLTRINLLAGLIGAYIIRHPDVETPLGLPSGDEFDRPLLVFDRGFRTDGSIYMNSTGNNPSIHPQWQPEYFGDAIIVNGKAWPRMTVRRRKYRFRIINASNARFFRFFFTNGLRFIHVGSDSAYLNEPVVTNEILLGPSEITDVVIDFSMSKNDTAILANNAPYPYPSGDPVNEVNSKVVKFDILKHQEFDTCRVPKKLIEYPAPSLSSVSRTRYIAMYEYTSDIDEPTHLYINGKPYEAPVTEAPKVGATEIWNIINLTEDNHPLHIHLGLFKTLDQTKLVNLEEFKSCMTKINDAIKCQISKHARGKKIKVLAHEKGWKNVYKMTPGYVTRILVKFSYIHSNASYAFDATSEPGYVYHCHILDHEDNVMMRPLKFLN